MSCNPIKFILWLIVLLFIGWFIGFLCASVKVFLLPFTVWYVEAFDHPIWRCVYWLVLTFNYSACLRSQLQRMQ